MNINLYTHLKYRSRWLSSNFLNSRDLGGLQLSNGDVTNFCIVFRISSGREFIPNVVHAISNSVDSVVHFIDLRTQEEIDSSKNESDLVNLPKIVLHKLPLHNSNFESTPNSEKNSLFFLHMYNEMIYLAADVVIYIANLIHDNYNPVVIGCLYGKDRTGVVTMLLLYFAGVRFSDIIKDFCLTARAFRKLPEQVSILSGDESPSEVLRRCELPVIAVKNILYNFLQVPGGRMTAAKKLGIDQNSLNKIQKIFSAGVNKIK